MNAENKSYEAMSALLNTLSPDSVDDQIAWYQHVIAANAAEL